MNRVIIGLGSNIEPEQNIQKAKAMLAQRYTVLAESTFKTTEPVGTIEQANFINGSVLIETELTIEGLKAELNGIESSLGRLKTDQRYGPRTIDLDIVVWNETVLDQHFYERDFLRESVLELIPDLKYQKHSK